MVVVVVADDIVDYYNAVVFDYYNVDVGCVVIDVG